MILEVEDCLTSGSRSGFSGKGAGTTSPDALEVEVMAALSAVIAVLPVATAFAAVAGVPTGSGGPLRVLLRPSMDGIDCTEVEVSLMFNLANTLAK